MKKQHLSMGAFPKQLDHIQDLLDHPEKLKHRFRITSVYGSFPNITWNGGRNHLHLNSRLDLSVRESVIKNNQAWYDPLAMENLVKFYNDRKIGVRYTFTNALVTKRHLRDARANLALEIAHNPLNAVITGNPIIEEYVRKKYPRFQIVGSVTATSSLSLPFLKRRINEVDILVLPPEYNARFELIEKLGAAKVEVLINERCAPFCPFRQKHYRAISRSQIALNLNHENRLYYNNCPVNNAREMGNEPPHMVMDDNLVTALQKIGVAHFKFVGRHLAADDFISEVDAVLIKRKYRFDYQEATVSA
jgi:collagenase-like PrtC family protease